jgi:uncharacterized membrane protein YkvI
MHLHIYVSIWSRTFAALVTLVLLTTATTVWAQAGKTLIVNHSSRIPK